MITLKHFFAGKKGVMLPGNLNIMLNVIYLSVSYCKIQVTQHYLFEKIKPTTNTSNMK